MLQASVCKCINAARMDKGNLRTFSAQDLLAHPFLHPSMAQEPPVPASTQLGLTQEHLQAMLSAMVAASGGGEAVDVGALAESVFHK
eukprot:scaffold270430_cov41-Prasinocladus_malaysianus.AAC.1